MKRLTKRFGKANEKACYYTLADSHTEDYAAINRLGEYEDLGVTPEQIRQIDDLFRQMCEKVNKLQSQIKAATEIN